MGYIEHTAPPVVVKHEGIFVVRDDLYRGGTKARFIPALFAKADEVVYASSGEGGAQVALATIARSLGKKATIVGPVRAIPHPRQLEAKRLGAHRIPVRPGYLNVMQARARAYCEQSSATLAPSA
jgi:threonine dehydratase